MPEYGSPPPGCNVAIGVRESSKELRMRLNRTAALAVALLSTTVVIYAQVAAGTFNVEVQDSSGALIPGGIITLTHVGSGQVRTGGTAASGTFRAACMPDGQ